jgi:DNA polymerase IV
MSRAILHVDMDAFYAAIEERENPAFTNQPLIIAGLGRRGVVSTANYRARTFGVRSAMPTAQAKQRCPDGVFIAPRMALYSAVSAQIFEIFRRFTPEVEGLSLDEAFLDVGASLALFGSARQIATRIKAEICSDTLLIASVGIAANKFVAKLASERGKPDGLLEIAYGAERAFLDPLPIGAMWGIGRVSEPKLIAAGISTFADLINADPGRLRPLLGRDTERLQTLARGIDTRPVVADREEQSIGAEETFGEDLVSLNDAERELLGLTERVTRRLRDAGLESHRLIVKVRLPPFETHTLSRTLTDGFADTTTLYQHARDLLKRWWQQTPNPRLRLLGISAHALKSPAQSDLFSTERPNTRTEALVDRIRDRFGNDTLKRAKSIR